MSCKETQLNIPITTTGAVCPIGETTGKRNIIDEDRLVQFDALSHYNRYIDIFDYEDVPENERKTVA